MTIFDIVLQDIRYRFVLTLKHGGAERIMGSRFRKTVKITKGIKVNFSKSGASLSLGGRGHSLNFSSRGTRSTVGIPGSGLSYSSLVSSKNSNRSKSTSSRSSTTRSSVQLPHDITIRMNDRGQITIEDESGLEITNKAVLRKIKTLPQFQSQIAILEEKRKERIDDLVREAEEENNRFLNIYQLTPKVETLQDFERRYQSLRPDEYIVKTFDKPAPSEASIMWAVTQEAEEKVTGSIFKKGKLKKQYIAEHFPKSMFEATEAWKREREVFDNQQLAEKEEKDRMAIEECNNQKAFLRALILGNEGTVCDVFDSWIGACSLPVEINIDYNWNQNAGEMSLDVDLPEIEDLPTTKLVKTDNGNIKEKKKTQAELREEYAKLVFGLAIFISVNTFNISPAIQKVLISGYTQRINKQGDTDDVYIYSLKISRDIIEQTDCSTILPGELCAKFEHRYNMTTTSLFKAIVPFEEFG